jgi:hypothetical protein
MASHVQAFFTEPLCHHQRGSPQTLARCRDTFRLVRTFVQDTVGIEPAALWVPARDVPTILAVLDLWIPRIESGENA